MFQRARQRRIRRWAGVGSILGAMGSALVLTAGTASAAGVAAHPGLAIRNVTQTADTVTDSECTIGLTGHVGKARYAVTAGHCVRDGEITTKEGQPLGWFDSSRPDNLQDNNLDFGFGLLHLYDGVDVSASMGRFGITSVDTHPQNGQQVCKIGATTGWHCGTITDATPQHIFATKELGAEAGDSGGVVYRQTNDGQATFVGILIAYDSQNDHQAVIEPAQYLFDQINKFGPTKKDQFIWYKN